MVSDANLILNKKQVLQKIKRIAFEIYEQNVNEQEVVLCGIYDRGYYFAKMLEDALQEVSDLKVKLVKVQLDKPDPEQHEVTFDCDLKSLKHKSVVIVDDVLNTGKTLIYSLRPLLNVEIKKVQIAVLVDRSHKLFPVWADYVGYSLSTTIKEHVEVVLDEENFGVYLR
ncbi:phosphoribosyltransferase family protein [Cytophagaceae bacterium ABcell3]|nr:phosphoribosyltransferase family protein [Cytophagaceae bacterium ABcell3]